FFALFGSDLELHPALLNKENALGGITLREDFVVFWALRNSSCQAHCRKKHLGIERNPSLLFPSRLRWRTHPTASLQSANFSVANDSVTVNQNLEAQKG